MEDSNFKFNQNESDDYYPQSRNQLYELEDQQQDNEIYNTLQRPLKDQSKKPQIQNSQSQSPQIDDKEIVSSKNIQKVRHRRAKKQAQQVALQIQENQEIAYKNVNLNALIAENCQQKLSESTKISNVVPIKVIEVKPPQIKVQQTDYSKRRLNGQCSDDEHFDNKYECKQQKNPNFSTKEQKTLQYVEYQQDQVQQNQQESSSQQEEQEIRPNSKYIKQQSQMIDTFFKGGNKQKLISFKGSSIYELAYTSLPPRYRVKCLVKESKSFFSGDTYDLFLEDDKRHFLRATRGLIPLSSKFEIHDVKSKKKIGEMFKNFTGTQFVLYRKSLSLLYQDRQYSSEKATKNTSMDKLQQKIEEEAFNQQISWICYTPNLFGFSGQKSITVVKRLKRAPKTERFSDLKSCWQQGDLTRIQILSQKLAQKRNGTYQLDFHGVVKLPSTKNTIIQDDKRNQCLVFGKRSDNIYSMHVAHPLSLIQAFALAVSNLDRKLIVH